MQCTFKALNNSGLHIKNERPQAHQTQGKHIEQILKHVEYYTLTQIWPSKHGTEH